MVVEYLAFGVTCMTIGIGLAKWTEDEPEEPVEQEGCNGHHWQDPEPEISDFVPSEMWDYDELQHVSISRASKYIRLKCDATKRCEDCGETRKVEVRLGELTIDEFLDAAEADDEDDE